MKRKTETPLDSEMRSAARRTAQRMWFDVDETRAVHHPYTFMLVGRISGPMGMREMELLMQDATQRLMRGENGKSVRERLQQSGLLGVTLSASVEELERQLLGHFRLGDNSVEGGPSELGRGKHIGWLYTYHSDDHKLF